jgi:hypothetical protein
MAKTLGGLFGVFFVMYGIFYPVIYFVYNFFISGIGFPQYQIPDFWVGMAGFFILIVVKNILFGKK